jgi:hypothetical protein
MHTRTRSILATLAIGLGIALLAWITSGALAQGDGWSPATNLSSTEGSSYAPRLGVDAQNTVHLVWYDWVDTGTHWPYLLYANKPAGGGWSSYSYLPSRPQGIDPAMVVGADGALHVVWEGGGIRYARRAPGGTWDGVEDVSTGGELRSPDVAVAPDGTVHVVWRKRLGIESSEIYCSAKPPGGTWSAPSLASTWADVNIPLAVVDSEGTIHLLMAGYGAQVLYTSKSAGGDWSTPEEMPFAPVLLNVEQLTSDAQGALHLAWKDENRVLYASKPLDQAWSGPHTVFSGPGLGYVAVAADGQGLAHVAWTASSKDNSVWYAFERSDGAWSPESLAGAGLAGYDHTPSVAAGGDGGRHIAWDSGPVYDPPVGDGRGEVWYTGLTGWPPVTGIITPAGGTLGSASGDTSLVFPPGAVAADTQVTHTPAGSPPTGDLTAVKIFDLSAERVSDGVPVTSFEAPYTITVDYTDAEKGGAIESTLGLYWWDGSEWLREPTSSVDEENNRVAATPEHMTYFSVLGETRRVCLPLVVRNW